MKWIFVFFSLFALSLATECTTSQDYVFNDESGDFGCDSYSNRVTVTWTINIDSPNRILLEFTEFDTEADYDFISLYDGDNAEDGFFLGSFSGSTIPGPFESSGSSLFVVFTADAFVQGSGFHATWSTFSNEEGVVPCNSNEEYNLSGDEGSFGCGGYADNVDISWLISGNDNERIILSFEEFETEYNYDFVSVYDGNTANPQNLVGTYSGSELPPPVTASGNQLYITFHSDESVVSSGFVCSWTSIFEFSDPCFNSTNQILFAHQGYIGCPYGYGNNVNSTWLIRIIGNFNIELDFLTLDLESGYDFVDVFDGSSMNSERIGHFSGSQTPSPVVSSGNSLLIVLQSDFSTTSDGFTATYQAYHTLQPGGCSNSGIYVLTEPEDSFGCDGYLNGVTEEWHLLADSPDQVISLEWEYFDTEAEHDLIYVYDGNSTSSTLIYSFSGSELPDPAVSSQPSMLVRFVADANQVQGSGFSAQYEAVAVESDPTLCEASHSYHLTNPEGIFGCDGYGDGVSVSWTIELEEGFLVLLEFTTFFTENGYDFVTVYDGPNANSPSLGSWSGVLRPPALSSSSRYLFVQFTSDEGVNRSGFSAEYSSYFTGSDAGDCFDSGVQTLTEPEGSFGCDGYGPDVVVSWAISTSTGSRIAVDFSSFQTELSYDILRIYDGPDKFTSPVIAEYSGFSIPPPIQSSSNQLFIEFASDESIQYDGFNANYHIAEQVTGIVPCTHSAHYEFDEPAGEFGCDGYSDGIDSSWLISAEEGQKITISFPFFDIELYYDYLKIYDGNSTTARVFGPFSGDEPPQEFTSSGNSAYVTLHTDSSVSGDGFIAEYVSFGSFEPDCFSNETFTLTEPSADFGCDGYGNSVIVSWSISSFGNIFVQFEHFDLETSFDLLFIYDGENSNAPLLATYTGRRAQPIVSSSTNLYIELQSDQSVTRTGFTATYDTVIYDDPPYYQY